MAQGNVFSLLSRSWRLLLVATLVSGALGFVISSRMAPSYQASVELLTGPVNTDYNTLQASGQLARTYAELAKTRPLLDSVAKQVGIKGGGNALDKKVNATSSTVTRIVTIYAADSNAKTAQQLATAIADRLRRLQVADAAPDTRAVDELIRRSEIQALPSQTRDAIRAAALDVFAAPAAGRLSVVNPAEVPTAQSGPPVVLITLLAAIAGFVVMFLILWVRDVLRRPVRSEDDLNALRQCPPLGTVIIPRGPQTPVTVARAFADSAVGEGYRLLFANVGTDERGAATQSIAVIDADEHVTARAVGAGIAAAAAEAGLSVALVDPGDDWSEADRVSSRRWAAARSKRSANPNPMNRWPTTVSSGASNGDGDDSVSSLDFTRVLMPGVSLVSGVADQHAGSITRVLEEISAAGFDLAVVVLPPVTRSSAGLAWARACQANVLTANRYRTSTDAVVDAAEALNRAGVRLIGTVLVDGKPAHLKATSTRSGPRTPTAAVPGDAEPTALATERR